MTLSGDDTLAKEMLAGKLSTEIAEGIFIMHKAFQFEKDGEGDGKTHTIMRVVREDDLHDILDEWIDHIRGEADGEEVSERRDQMLRIDNIVPILDARFFLSMIKSTNPVFSTYSLF